MKAALAALLARPLAHRGLHDRGAGIIENSLAAAEAAVAAGFGIECDIQLAGDGEAVVFHDETLDRLTRETGRVDARPSDALATLGLRDARASDTIPTLALFLARLAGRVPLVIELKSHVDHDLGLADRAVAVLASYGGVVGIKSFDPRLVSRCRALGATCPVGLVGPPERPALWDDNGGDQVLFSYDFLSWNIRDLAALRARAPDIPLMSWTVRSSADAAEARRRGAQIVFEGFKPS